MTERELNGPAVDQVFGSETVTPGSGGGTQSAGTANWLLGDPQGTARDVAQFTAGSGGGTSILDHIVYNSFGQITYQSTPGDRPRFTYTGQRLDRDTGLTYEGSGNSWYDAVDGVFASQGASEYNGTNPYEYSGNNPAATDLVVSDQTNGFGSAVGLMSGGGTTVPVFPILDLDAGNGAGNIPVANMAQWNSPEETQRRLKAFQKFLSDPFIRERILGA